MATQTAELMRRIAAAASGFIGEGEVWFVANLDTTQGVAGDPYDVAFFTSQAAADQEQATRTGQGIECAVFGPFDTPAGVTSLAGQQDVLEFGAEFADGGTTEFAGGKFDTLFCSVASVRNFAVPYYAALYSPDYAQKVLDTFAGAEYRLMGHLPWTEYEEIGPTVVPAFLKKNADGSLHWQALTPHGWVDVP